MQELENKISERKKELENLIQEYDTRLDEGQIILGLILGDNEQAGRIIRNRLEQLLAVRTGYSARLDELKEL
jgi:hypothetical protein